MPLPRVCSPGGVVLSVSDDGAPAAGATSSTTSALPACTHCVPVGHRESLRTARKVMTDDTPATDADWPTCSENCCPIVTERRAPVIPPPAVAPTEGAGAGVVVAPPPAHAT